MVADLCSLITVAGQAAPTGPSTIALTSSALVAAGTMQKSLSAAARDASTVPFTMAVFHLFQ
ncbi:MAG: hypothetical protein IJQ93_08555 [Bacteroidales bacterium]|nr:hypothetical protein [Bacteroidales bacterium]